MADNIIIFSGKQYAGKDTAAKIMLDKMPNYRRCAMEIGRASCRERV